MLSMTSELPASFKQIVSKHSCRFCVSRWQTLNQMHVDLHTVSAGLLGLDKKILLGRWLAAIETQQGTGLAQR